MDTFQIFWMKVPILFRDLPLASPWVLYQVWAFIAPGLYKKERRLAVPFVLSSAGLFILGGVFAYFVAFATDSNSFSAWESAKASTPRQCQ
jgi:sec-independent protein translocase protein TatC